MCQKSATGCLSAFTPSPLTLQNVITHVGGTLHTIFVHASALQAPTSLSCAPTLTPVSVAGVSRVQSCLHSIYLKFVADLKFFFNTRHQDIVKTSSFKSWSAGANYPNRYLSPLNPNTAQVSMSNTQLCKSEEIIRPKNLSSKPWRLSTSRPRVGPLLQFSGAM